MRFWCIEVTEHWDDRMRNPKGPPFRLPFRPYLFRGPCQWRADGWSVASDHNAYRAVPVELTWRQARDRNLVILDKDYYRHALPRKVSFRVSNWIGWVRVRLPYSVNRFGNRWLGWRH